MNMQLHTGTSGFSYKEWKGSFYPKDLPNSGMLRYYAERFKAVEINNTFYRMPTAESLKPWIAEVPRGFAFTLKAPQLITHFKRLKDINEPVAKFLKAADVLKDHLGALLFQLPPNMKKDIARLSEFFKILPSGKRAALEFRHPTWFEEDVFDLMRDRGIALCIAEAEDSVAVPFVTTCDWAYVRLRMQNYTSAQLKKWLERMQKAKLDEAFVFFKHEDEGNAPRFATRFVECARRSAAANVKE
jgi:uncharacterized protein YecE (DUF72 family)